MTTGSGCEPRASLLALAVVLLLSGSPVAAAEDELPPIELLQKHLLGIQKNITNVTMKVPHDWSGAGSPGGSTERPPTPAEKCCSGNIKRMNNHVREMMGTIEQLGIYFTERNDAEALMYLGQVRGELSVVTRGLAIFKMSGTVRRAQEALLGIIRPFNRLRVAIGQLHECCPVENLAPTGGSKKNEP